MTVLKEPWWKQLLWLFGAFVIAGMVNKIYNEFQYKKDIPIEKVKTEWQYLGSSVMMFEDQNYNGEVFFDRLNIEKNTGKVTMWVKIKTDRPVNVQKKDHNFSWDEQVSRLIVNCESKDVKMDYIGLYSQGKKQFGHKIDDLNLPIMKGTTSHMVYESFCM